MLMRRSRFVFVLFLLAALVHPAWGATPEGQARSAMDLLDRLWSALTGIWAEAGCIIDPHGGCAAIQAEPPAPAPSTDEGCIIDPNGGCAPRS